MEFFIYGVLLVKLKPKAMKKLFTLTTFLLSLCVVHAQTGEIKGKVFDEESKQTLPGANVYVEVAGNMVGTMTDVDGRFTLKPLPPGIYNLHASFMGYQKYILKGVNVNPDKITFINDIQLAFNTNMMNPYNVVEYKVKLIDAEQPSKMTILAADIEKLPDTRNLANVVAGITADVKVSDDGQQIFFRGSRSGAGAYYIDGMRVSDINSTVPGVSVGSVTVYSGGVPAQYGDFTGGVVVIETKSYFDLYNQHIASQMYK